MTENFKSKIKKLSDSLNPAKIYGNDVFNKTVKYQKMYGFGMGAGKEATHNNEADAFKHTFMQADIALKTNLGISKAFGDKHEDDGNKKQGQLPEEENMDKWNNRVGREIAAEIEKEIGNPIKLKAMAHTGQLDDLIAQKVVDRMKKGKLITKLNDTRKFVETKEMDFLKNLEKVYTFEEIGKMKPEEFRSQQDRILSDFVNRKMIHDYEAAEKVQSGELIYVQPYERADGTKVEGYYRRK